MSLGALKDLVQDPGRTADLVVNALGLPVILRSASQHPGADNLCRTLGGNTSTASDLNEEEK